MRNPAIDKTFAAIRNLPLEVEFANIEQFVLQQPLPNSPNHSFLKKITPGSLLLLIAASITIIVIMMLSRTTQKSAAPSHKPTAAIIQEAASTKTDLPPVIKSVSSEKIKIQSSTKEGTRTSKSSKPIIPKEETISTLLTTSSPEPQTETSLAPIPNNSEQQTEKDNDKPARVRTITSCYCNFGDDDAWIKAFIRAMEEDRIISDTAGLRFTITATSFKVNGKFEEESIAAKYNDLYQSFTGERLNQKSYISLSVGGSCTLSKSIDE